MALFGGDAVPPPLINAWGIWAMIKQGVLAPFNLSELDALPASLVRDIQLIAGTVAEVQEAEREAKGLGGKK